MKHLTLFLFLLAAALVCFRLFFCPFVPFAGGVVTAMALAHELNGLTLGTAIMCWIATGRRSPLAWFYFFLWLIPGLVEGLCFALHVSH